MKYISVILFLAFFFTAAPASAELTPTPTTYLLAIPAATAQKTIDNGIEKAVEEMMFITRPIARNRLKNTNSPYKSISFQKDGDKITIWYENLPKITRQNGKSGKWKRDDGEIFTVTHKMDGNSITQKFVAEDGVKTLTYVFSKDFSNMNVTVRLESPKLAAPMLYTLQYKKK